MSEGEITRLLAYGDPLLNGKSGVRIFGGGVAEIILSPDGTLSRIAEGVLGAGARPVRALLFDKTAEANWAVGWHQDRTIAVRDRHDVADFGPWSRKDGALHVEPPFEILRDMITLRAHLDDCDAENAPLLIVPGSHKLGRVPVAEVPTVPDRLGLAVCLAECRDVWVYATAIVHGSRRAHRPRRRRVLQVDYAAHALPAGLQWLGIAA